MHCPACAFVFDAATPACPHCGQQNEAAPRDRKRTIAGVGAPDAASHLARIQLRRVKAQRGGALPPPLPREATAGDADEPTRVDQLRTPAPRSPAPDLLAARLNKLTAKTGGRGNVGQDSAPALLGETAIDALSGDEELPTASARPQRLPAAPPGPPPNATPDVVPLPLPSTAVSLLQPSDSHADNDDMDLTEGTMAGDLLVDDEDDDEDDDDARAGAGLDDLAALAQAAPDTQLSTPAFIAPPLASGEVAAVRQTTPQEDELDIEDELDLDIFPQTTSSPPTPTSLLPRMPVAPPSVTADAYRIAPLPKATDDDRLELAGPLDHLSQAADPPADEPVEPTQRPRTTAKFGGTPPSGLFPSATPAAPSPSSRPRQAQIPAASPSAPPTNASAPRTNRPAPLNLNDGGIAVVVPATPIVERRSSREQSVVAMLKPLRDDDSVPLLERPRRHTARRTPVAAQSPHRQRPGWLVAVVVGGALLLVGAAVAVILLR
ncbi:MAG: hypothetical protein H6707_05535 [Deltaproteobacteria bacterium]|nr:hypothetical protein [Deltaproteobacteria bacterium]